MDFHYDSPEDYTAYHTRKQKDEIRRSLKKKIDTYNKKLKKKPSKTLADSLPISKPTEVSILTLLLTRICAIQWNEIE